MPPPEAVVIDEEATAEAAAGPWGFVELPEALIPPTARKRPPGPPDKRRHLTLVEREHLLMIANIPKSVADAFATEYAEADEFNDPVVRSWLDYQLMLSVSKQGRGRDDLVRAMRGEEEERDSLDSGIQPKRGID